MNAELALAMLLDVYGQVLQLRNELTQMTGQRDQALAMLERLQTPEHPICQNEPPEHPIA